MTTSPATSLQQVTTCSRNQTHRREVHHFSRQSPVLCGRWVCLFLWDTPCWWFLRESHEQPPGFFLGGGSKSIRGLARRRLRWKEFHGCEVLRGFPGAILVRRESDSPGLTWETKAPPNIHGFLENTWDFLDMGRTSWGGRGNFWFMQVVFAALRQPAN